jgi:hypothetical protein
MRRLVWRIGCGFAGLLVTALGVLLARQGLDRADKLASIFGLFVGLAGLVVTVYSAWLAKTAAQAPSSPSNSPRGGVAPGRTAHVDGGGQSVTNSRIDGSNIQIGAAGGDVRIDRD